jgi:hypothetical protein
VRGSSEVSANFYQTAPGLIPELSTTVGVSVLLRFTCRTGLSTWSISVTVVAKEVHLKKSVKYLPVRQFVCHKTYTDCPAIELGTPYTNPAVNGLRLGASKRRYFTKAQTGEINCNFVYSAKLKLNSMV